MARILLINGSPHEKGCTYTALMEVRKGLEEWGIESELYWIGNITGHVTNEGWPRWPLQIVEVDETYGTAKKESLTVIDTRREGESV